MTPASESILLPGKPSVSSASRTICLVCQKQFSQYTCPRCNARYCSVNCYKKHNLRCTESFTRENVMDEMKQMHHDDGMKRKTMEMLKRVHLEEEAEHEAVEVEIEDSFLSQETIEKVLSGKDLSLEELNPGERKHFQRAISSGVLSKMIQPWHPWWLNPSARSLTIGRDGTHLVRPLNNIDQSTENESTLSEIPHGSETPLPSLSTLTSRPLSPILPVHFLEVLYSYCFTLRLYNGEWQSDHVSAASTALTMSPVLAGDREREVTGIQEGDREIEALEAAVLNVINLCLERTCSPEFKHVGGIRLGQLLVNDVVRLLVLGRDALICLLCDFRRLVQAAQTTLKSEKLKRETKLETRKKLGRAEKKIYFFLSWVNDQRGGDLWASLASQVEAEMLSFEEMERPTHKEERRKLLIEEMLSTERNNKMN